MSRSSIIVLAVSALFGLAVLLSARRRRTPERHTFSWLLVSVFTAALAIWRGAIDAIAAAMGIYYAPSALFFLVCLVLLWLLFRLSLQVAEQRSQIQRLAQELAVLTAQREPQSPAGATASEDPGPPVR
ncbi:hypothetical protein SAMN05444354_108150 [Stigmatella aurantiaca]|uniref:DUF2304 domain-containing protein n=1 Tax=Stigmatella aurantiaca TaxID=41 RepID=A0A1H7SVR3_STIAU|nr:DUF2304 domain-containing protein [Stigmatella aurantiaca]SEL76445.1 hypothetical protein SAMN05444354_108150 [Stigmatella aurantiaca]